MSMVRKKDVMYCVCVQAGLQTSNEALSSQVRQLKEQLEREKQATASIHKAKVRVH